MVLYSSAHTCILFAHGAFRHIVAIHARKSPLLVFLFTAGGEAFIRILTIFFKVERITKNATFK